MQQHAAVLVVGPRASGKTTTASRLVTSSLQLGSPSVSAAARLAPEAVLGAMPEPVLVDEWQEVPAVLQAIKNAIDADPRRGRFVLTGSVRGDIDAPTWPGTGRLVRLAMHGLTEREIEGAAAGPSWLESLLAGNPIDPPPTTENLRTYVERALRSGLPDVALRTPAPGRPRALASYVDQLVTRDAAAAGAALRDPARLRAYLQALALNSAGTVDDTTLWQAAGIAKDTARAFDALLTNLLVIERLPAWSSNRLKRLTLAPKRFLVDPGVMGAIWGASSSDVLTDIDLVGRLLETFVVAQVRAEAALLPVPPRLHHLRTAEGRREIDLVIEVGPRRLVAIEIKATATPSDADARHLRWLRESLGEASVTTVLLHTGPMAFKLSDGTLAAPVAALWEGGGRRQA